MERIKLAGFGRNGFVSDVAEYDTAPENFNEVRNVRFNSIGAVAFQGHRSVLAPAPIDPLWLRVFPPVDFPRWVYADRQQVYVFDDGHIDISRVGGYNGVLNERWQGEVFNGVGIFNNTVDVPQMWNAFSSAVPLQDLTNWPANLRCKFLRPFKVFLIAGFLTESGNDKPFRVRWSHPADPGTIPSSWEVGNPAFDSGELELAETDDYVVDGRTLGEAFIVYKQKTAHMMYLTGNQRVFGQRTIISGRGALTRDCIQDIPGGHFVAGIDDIYRHSGQKGSEESLVEATMRSWIYNQIDASNFFNCYTVDYRAANEVWFCFPEAGETYPTIAFVWNKITGGRGIRDIQRAPFMWSGPVDERTTDGDIWDPPEEEEPEIPADDIIIFEADTIAGAGGSIPCGFITMTMENFIGAPTTSTPSGTLISGTLAGSSSLGIATFSASGTEFVIALRLADADVLPSPQTAYWKVVSLPEAFLFPKLASAAFNFSTVSSAGFTTHRWGFTANNHLTIGEEYTVTFSQEAVAPVVLGVENLDDEILEISWSTVYEATTYDVYLLSSAPLPAFVGPVVFADLALIQAGDLNTTHNYLVGNSDEQEFALAVVAHIGAETLTSTVEIFSYNT